MAGKLATEKAAESFDKIIDLLESFECLEDPRQRGKVLYPLDEVLLLVLPGVIAGCESWGRDRQIRREKAGPASPAS